MLRLHLWSYPRAFYLLHGAHGCDRHPAFPAPSVLRAAERQAKLGQIMSRECEVASSSSTVIARLDRAIQYAAASRLTHRRLWNTGSPACAGDDTALLDILNCASSSSSSRRKPGPITQMGFAARRWGHNPVRHQVRWLWVPAFAGTTVVIAEPSRPLQLMRTRHFVIGRGVAFFASHHMMRIIQSNPRH